MTTPTLELRIPVSPNDKYMRMVRFLLQSIKLFGGNIAKNAACVLSISREVEPFDLRTMYPWLDAYDVIQRWTSEVHFSTWEYDGTGYDRFLHKTSADVVAMLDADLLVAGNFDELILNSYYDQQLLGFIAHSTPFYSAPRSDVVWREIFKAAGVPELESTCVCTGWGLMNHNPSHRLTPPYFNYGVLIAPTRVFELMAPEYLKDIKTIESVYPTWFRSQIANTVAIARHDISWKALSINDNFPMHVSYDRIRELNKDPDGRNSVTDIRVFHYLGEGYINKSDFESEAKLAALLDKKPRSMADSRFIDLLRKVESSF